MKHKQLYFSNMVLLHQAVCNLYAKSNFKLCNVLHDMYNKEVFHYVTQFMWQTKFTPYLLLVSLTWAHYSPFIINIHHLLIFTTLSSKLIATKVQATCFTKSNDTDLNNSKFTVNFQFTVGAKYTQVDDLVYSFVWFSCYKRRRCCTCWVGKA